MVSALTCTEPAPTLGSEHRDLGGGVAQPHREPPVVRRRCGPHTGGEPAPAHRTAPIPQHRVDDEQDVDPSVTGGVGRGPEGGQVATAQVTA